MDTKIVLQRASDYTHETSGLLRKNEIAHSYAVKQTNDNTEMQKTKVQDKQMKEDNTIKREREQKNQRQKYVQKKADVKESTLSDDNPEVASIESIIDIRI